MNPHETQDVFAEAVAFAFAHEQQTYAEPDDEFRERPTIVPPPPGGAS